MYKHHTKTKGDLAIFKCLADLSGRGFLVSLPMSEHAPFDLIAYKDQKFYRVQVKYRTKRNGALTVLFRTNWTDKHGTHRVPIDKNEIDRYCIYCPDTDLCYYFNPRLFDGSVTIRVDPSKNNQTANIKSAELFLDF